MCCPRTSLFRTLISAALLASAGSAAAQDFEIGDYGDAPDEGYEAYPQGRTAAVAGAFPTDPRTPVTGPGRYVVHVPDNDEPDALSVMRFHLGDEVTIEQIDNSVDADADDGVTFDWSRRRLYAVVTVTNETPEPLTTFLNVLVDRDRDGSWSGEGDWVIVNRAVELDPFEQREERFRL